MIQKIVLSASVILFLSCCGAPGQQVYPDETLISPLPEALVSNSGENIKSPEDWMRLRRPEILNLFEEHVYGEVPPTELQINYDLRLFDKNALSGSAVQKEVDVSISNGHDTLVFTILIYLPANAPKPVPLFLGLNFYGNQTVHSDEQISITGSWARNSDEIGIIENKATAKSRGVRSNRWPVEYILRRGYGLATIYYGEIDPDFHDGFQNGVHQIFRDKGSGRDSTAWGSISAWAWGLSRAMDYLETDPDVDAEKVAVMGHSRLGKTSLWAGALDERFALVISNNSGCGGAALSRRPFGERVDRINSVFPHWFASAFHRYNNNEAALPVDQHMLMSLIAPRPLYVASAEEDLWADPLGEYLCMYHASRVYGLFGEKAFQSELSPKVDKPFWSGSLAYHIRSGKHDVTLYDWEQYLKFADKHLLKESPSSKTNPVSENWIRERLPQSGPRLILSPELEVKVLNKLSAQDPVTVKGYNFLKQSARSVLDLDPLTYSVTGRRLLGVSREAIRRLSTLALVYRLDKDEVILQRLEQELESLCSFKDWNPSHFLDVAEMAAGISLALDWAGDWLSPEIESLARSALLEKALSPGMQQEHINNWVKAHHNWNLVCHGGLSMAALVVFEESPELATGILSRAVDLMPLALEPYGPDGIYPEGPSYWFYASTYLAAAISSFETALGTDFNFTKAPGIKESAVFSQVLAGPSRSYYNYFDAGLDGFQGHTHFGLLAWFAARSDLGFDWTAYENLMDEKMGNASRIPRIRFFPMHFLNIASMDQQTTSPFEVPSFWAGSGGEPIIVMRDKQNHRDAFFMAAKGGRAADNHGNMDAGSFIFELDGVRWSIDPGNQGYHQLEQIMGGELWNRRQESGRWDLLTKNNFGHSTLTVNVEKHVADARATLMHVDQRKAYPQASFDMSAIFGNMLKKAIRTFSRTSPTGLRISDHLVFSETTRTLCWQLMTRAEVEAGDAYITLQDGEKKIYINVMSDVAYEVKVVSLSPPPLEYDKDIDGLKRVEILFSRESFPGNEGFINIELSKERNPG